MYQDNLDKFRLMFTGDEWAAAINNPRSPKIPLHTDSTELKIGWIKHILFRLEEGRFPYTPTK